MEHLRRGVLVVGCMLAFGACKSDSRQCDDVMNQVAELSLKMDAEAAKSWGQPGNDLAGESRAMWEELKPKGVAFCRAALEKDKSLGEVLDCIGSARSSSDIARCPRVEELAGMLAPK